MINNPVLRGFNPDPSVVRVGEDYYLATSTMVWQPGIRLFHSRDLANWSLIGHALTEAEHDLRGLATHQGIWAPCLTYSEPERLFYLTYSLVLSTATDYFDVDNFLVTAEDVRGPWNEPVYLNSLGFDPSLFHDEDGRHWLVTLEWDPREGYEHPGAIVLEEYDSDRRALCGPSTRIFRGATDRGCLEGPHLYRRNGYYYLMAAEGGTGFGHGATLARSVDIAGPYEAGPVNPFLTSNPAPHFGRNDRDYLRPAAVQPECRAAEGRARLPGRHARGGVVRRPSLRAAPRARPEIDAGPGDGDPAGRVDRRRLAAADHGEHAGPAGDARPGRGEGLRPHQRTSESATTSTGLQIDRRFSTLRRPWHENWVFLDHDQRALRHPGWARLTSRFDVSLVATQLQDLDAVAETQVRVEPAHFSQSAGLVAFYDDKNFAYLRLYRSESLCSNALGIVLVENGAKQELLGDRVAVHTDEVVLQLSLQHGTLRFRLAPGPARSPSGTSGRRSTPATCPTRRREASPAP